MPDEIEDSVQEMKAKAVIVEDVAAILKCSTEQVPEKVEQLVARHRELEEEIRKHGGQDSDNSGEDA